MASKRRAIVWSDQDAPRPPAEHSTAAKESHPAAARASEGKRTIARFSGKRERLDQLRRRIGLMFQRNELATDLANDIGSARWLRGTATMLGLSAVAIAAWPGFSPVEAAPAMRIDDRVRDEFRSQMIMPLGLGADSGRRMGATFKVEELARAPERPRIDLVATLTQGDGFERMLRRAGVGSGEAGQIATMLAGAMPLSEIAPGTQVDITLGRRTSPDAPRPVDGLSFRARFDLQLAVERRENGGLALMPRPIAVDATPLRIRGTVGEGIYRSARAAGAPPSAVQQFLRTIGQELNLDRDISATDEFDFILDYKRAATGEIEVGKLQYAAILRDGKPHKQMMRWGREGLFYDAAGVGEERHGMVAPVPGPISSNFGMRRHPILGYRRMHSGMDFRARSGTPIVAVSDGRVASAGRAGGCGNAVKLSHGGGLETRYCHMSRMAVRSGQSVKRGQVIGYVGSTGLSTGPHLHYEMYRGGRAINPASVKFVTRAQLEGRELANFRASLAGWQTVEPGAALAALAPASGANEDPVREIDRLENRQRVN